MFRRLKRRSLRLILLVGSVCYLLSIFLFHATLDRDFSSSDTLYWIKPFFDPFEIGKSRLCSWKGQKVGHVLPPRALRTMSFPNKEDTNICMVDNHLEADIQMVDEWEEIGVGYPQLVMTVTGWVDTIQVDSWSMRPLHVVVVPFSHQDPGWKCQYDNCYQTYAKPTLSQVVSQLTKDPQLTFVWAETVFLERWWKEATSQQRNNLKSLLQTGRFELLGGGWVMPDEASTHYAAILDQLTEGHLWIAETFGLTVNTSWAIDPFGHSSTMAYINREAGIKNMLIQRTHFAVKRHFAKKRYLEFFWQKSWGRVGESIFCHMMPFLLYSIPHSCGPDRHVCCKFDFDRAMCFKGKKKTGPFKVTENNIDSFAQALWEQLRKKSEIYQSDVVLMPHGDDFRYNFDSEWTKQFENLIKIMEYINKNKDMHMKIEFGTLNDYFDKVHKSKVGPDYQRYPTLMGDFFPYSDRGDQYWSGVYTSRPFYKWMARMLQSKLRSAEVLFTMAQARKLFTLTNATLMYDKLTTVRRSLALFQHHDAITGTSKKDVVFDYAKRLYAAMIDLQDIQSSTVKLLMDDRRRTTQSFQPAEIWLNVNELPSPQVIDVKRTRYLVVSNPLFHWRHDVVSVHLNSVYVKVMHEETPVKVQISPVFDNNTVQEEQYLLAIEVNLPPAGLIVFQLKPTESLDQSQIATIRMFSRPSDSNWFRNFGPFKVSLSADEAFSIGNNNISATVSVCDGTLKFVQQDGHIFKSDVHFVSYRTGTSYNPLKDKSGAYIFLPDGAAKESEGRPVAVYEVSGSLFTQARTVYKDIIHHITIFNITGPKGAAVLIENLVNVGNVHWNNRELAMRLETDIISSEHYFCTDSNGFQMQKRKTRLKLGIQGNFYPVTTSAFLEDDYNRVTILTSEAHGVASLASGIFDIILDRRLMQDDWRGLNEGVTDNRPTRSSFHLMFETKIKHTVYKSTAPCYLSPSASIASLLFNNRPDFLTVTTLETATSISKMSDVPSLPCGYHVVNLRMLKVYDDHSLNECLLILHRTASDCVFSARHQHCGVKTVKISSLLPFMRIVSVIETSITGVTAIRSLNPDDSIDVPLMEIKTYKIAFR